MPTHSTLPRKDARLEVRLPADLKELLDQAAASLGMSTSAFVLTTMTERAQEALAHRQVMALNPAESRTFVEHLLNPPQPHNALQKAAARYWARIEHAEP
ncbi:DUF1778 domain-containing protein [Sulfobacillus thermosulfidooxidans]|uniref:type II toxin-antitoxin system TacA family antitoxin n=1 Tax=Sulfobacillus thermosulfidooxidans TaxID=28034 RepID=UPI0006B5EF64|nr:DUF1778 domain-containing protein [Sulfobacillus thermosulfidooxidans]